MSLLLALLTPLGAGAVALAMQHVEHRLDRPARPAPARPPHPARPLRARGPLRRMERRGGPLRRWAAAPEAVEVG